MFMLHSIANGSLYIQEFYVLWNILVLISSASAFILLHLRIE